MIFQLTQYQDRAAQELLEDTNKLLRQSGDKKLIFKAPTGSGKTIMTAEFLARFADDTTHVPCAFIWAAPRQLHEQSKEKIETYFEDSRAMDCSFFEDLNDRQIGENEILFFNWESIRQDKLIYIRENEQDNNLSNILERTREAGREIVLIIDESHFHAQAETSQDIISVIAPKLTIEVSATPKMQNPDEMVSINIDDVKMEEMIKKAVVLNENFKNLVQRGRTETIRSELSGSTDDIVLREALKKRKELAGIYKSAGIDVNPLLIIQLPDRRGQADEDRQALIVENLNKHGIGVGNGKLAIYLSENKENLENITRNNSEVEVLIFKQAIALGWDCPRAQILVLFREWSSPIFSIQTIGRVMRMPEPEQGYYDNDILNYAYVYTNLEDIEIKEDIGRAYVVIHTSKRIADYQRLSLPSVHRKRHREHTRLNPLFTKLFLSEAEAYGLAVKIKTKNQKVQMAFISDWQTDNIDQIAGKHIHADALIERASDMDLQRLFDYFVRKNLTPFYPEDRSIGRIRESIYRFFAKQFGLERADQFHSIINIVLSEDNRTHFVAVIDAAKRVYIADTERREKELAEDVWEVPERLMFGDGYFEMETKKSVMLPFCSNERWQSEKAFIQLLETPKSNVVWWFKNGDRDATFFAVPYGPKDSQSPFYVDFVVMMKDGSIGFFDPHGVHLADFSTKSNGLRAYISGLQEEGRKVFGGIVANTESRNLSGQWMVYEGTGENIREGNWENWTRLDL